MNALQVFDNQEFGQVRTVVINNEPYFVGKDVAKILGYADTINAIKQHVDNDDKQKSMVDIRTKGVGGKMEPTKNTREITIINESGLFSLALCSKLPAAKRFKHWVTSEVLPE